MISTGKWRRQLVIPYVEECAETALPEVETRLPANQAEGDLPKIALTTGAADALECLIHKLGIDDSEVTTDAGAGRVHFYLGNGGVSSLSNGGALPSATTLWSSVDKLKQYDLVLLSCEGAQYPTTKPQPALDAMKAYADLGGRIFASHWHNIWIEGVIGGAAAPAFWPTIATWTNTTTPTTLDTIDLIDEVAHPKGAAFVQLHSVRTTDAAGWQELEIVSDVRSDARHLIIRLEANKQSVLFDDVTLEILARSDR